MSRRGKVVLINSHHFPDGTCITSGFIIEDEPVVCDWTEEELQLYFVHKCKNISFNQRQGVSITNELASSVASRSNLKEEMKEMLTVDSFVSILLTCRMEHRNYAGVEFDTSKLRCTLRTSDGVKVGIMPDSCYSVRVGSDALLQATNNSIEFTKITCEKCEGRSISTYKLISPPVDEVDPVMFQNADVFGNVIKLHHSGKIDYKNVTSCECMNSGIHHCVDYADSKTCHRPMEKCLPPAHAEPSGFRIFAMNRDFTAFEYLHQSAEREAKKDVTPDMSSTLIHYPAAGILDSRYQSTLTFPDEQTKLARCIQEAQRKPSLRSTYSIPYDWLFPFGKYGDGYQKHTFNSALKERSTKSPMKAQDGRNIEVIDTSTLIRLSKTVGSCWRLASCIDQSHV